MRDEDVWKLAALRLGVRYDGESYSGGAPRWPLFVCGVLTLVGLLGGPCLCVWYLLWWDSLVANVCMGYLLWWDSSVARFCVWYLLWWDSSVAHVCVGYLLWWDSSVAHVCVGFLLWWDSLVAHVCVGYLFWWDSSVARVRAIFSWLPQSAWLQHCLHTDSSHCLQK